MRALIRSLAPTRFEDVCALVALYRPGPDGHEHAQRVRRPQERSQAGRVLPRGPRGDPRTHLRADDLPRAADARRAEARGLLARRSRQPAQGRGQEEARPHGAPNARSSSPAASATATAPSSATRCSTSSSRSPTTRSRRRTPPATASSPTKPRGSRRTIPVQYLAALLTSVKTNLDQAAVYLNECRLLDIPVLVPDVNASASDFSCEFGDGTASGRDPLRALRGAQRRRGCLGAASSRSAEANGPFTDFHDFCERVDPSVLNKRTVESLIRGGAFDSLGTPARGPVHRVRADRRRRAAPPARARAGHDEPVRHAGAGRGDDARRRVRRPARRSPTSSSTRANGSGSRRRCSGLYVSDHPLMGAERALRRLRRVLDRRARRPRRRCDAHGRRRRHRAEPQVHQARRPDGDVRPRRHRRVDRGDGVPEDDAAVQRAARRPTRSSP